MTDTFANRRPDQRAKAMGLYIAANAIGAIFLLYVLGSLSSVLAAGHRHAPRANNGRSWR